MKLNHGQQTADNMIMDWFKSRGNPTFVLAGYAGTGKTTMAKHIAARIPKVKFLAYTGKAASVLRDKGCDNCSTIHSAIYKHTQDENGKDVFVFNPDNDLYDYDLVIVDEYSMVSFELRYHLEDSARKVLYLGDPFQLPPIGEQTSLEPDYFLEEVHRQAKDSTIIEYATNVRNGVKLQKIEKPDLRFISRSQVTIEDFAAADQIIVGRNNTRVEWNRIMRKRLGFDSTYPQQGEKLICLKNNHALGIYNGMIEEASDNATPPENEGSPTIETPFWFGDIKVWRGDFDGFKERRQYERNRYDRFDYAYAITCHKSQGSEFNNCAVYLQPIGDDEEMRRRWVYTAITRAAKKLLMVDSSN
jgi:exodeoxyribonuclease-5